MMQFLPNLPKRRIRLLAEAENLLLDAEANLESAQANAECLRKRVVRLRLENRISVSGKEPSWSKELAE